MPSEREKKMAVVGSIVYIEILLVATRLLSQARRNMVGITE